MTAVMLTGAAGVLPDGPTCFSNIFLMKKNDIPPELCRFMQANIPSVPHMEALMLVRASAPSRWCPHSLSRRLYVPMAAAAGVLADLCRSGLLLREAASDAYFYQYRRDSLCDSVEQLAALHATNLVEITALIHTKPAPPP